MASRLVETVMINVDDFSDNFLTCGTCFSGYDNNENSAKLLPCSHTICRSCLKRILETQVESESIQCPICRDVVPVPQGGAHAFPPAFIVNQLLDMISSQRRDVVPKCCIHHNQELLFCETCDVVFCIECRGRSHMALGGVGDSNRSSSAGSSDSLSPSFTSPLNHNVVSFNVAIKRCTEILLFKMQLCVQELNVALEAVTTELDRLDSNKQSCINSINASFAEILALVERRRGELLNSVSKMVDEKRRQLTNQMALVESEREAVRREGANLNGIFDVRSISKAINYLNDKLDTVTSLTEPRENAFLRYLDHPEPLCAPFVASPPVSSTTTSLVDIGRCLAGYGRLIVSTTYPALCTAELPPATELVTFLATKIIVHAVDYNGQPQSTGGVDPIDVSLYDSDGRPVPCELRDLANGTYQIDFKPMTAGSHSLSVKILSRPIRGSPFQLQVKPRQQPQWSLCQGPDNRSLLQPFALAYGPWRPSNPSSRPPLNGDRTSSDDSLSRQDNGSPSHVVYVLDTGNNRLLLVNPLDGLPLLSPDVESAIGTNDQALVGQAATGIALSSDLSRLWVINWRLKQLFLLDPVTSEVVQTICSPSFVEPTSICRCPLTNHLYIADNGAGCIFRVNPDEVSVQLFVGRSPLSAASSLHDADRQPSGEVERSTAWSQPCRNVTGLCVSPHRGQLIVATGPKIQIFNSSQSHVEELSLAKKPPVSSPLDPSTASIDSVSTRSFSMTNSVVLDDDDHQRRQSVVGDRFSISSSCFRRSNRTLTSSRNSSDHQLRGQFNGVTLTSDFHLLASYSDRHKSGVVVWTPQPEWAPVVAVDGQDNRRPYLIESEPAMRRLAGLVATPTSGSGSNSNRVIVVDQGGQAVHSLCYT